MTNNEEAIAILKREFSECKDTISVYARKRKKAFDMAIKALQAVEEADAELAEASVYDSYTIKAQQILRGVGR